MVVDLPEPLPSMLIRYTCASIFILANPEAVDHFRQKLAAG